MIALAQTARKRSKAGKRKSQVWGKPHKPQADPDDNDIPSYCGSGQPDLDKNMQNATTRGNQNMYIDQAVFVCHGMPVLTTDFCQPTLTARSARSEKKLQHQRCPHNLASSGLRHAAGPS